MRHSMRVGLTALALAVLGALARAEVDLPLISVLDGGHGSVTCVAFSPDGAEIAMGLYNREVIIWDLLTGARVMAIPIARHYVTSLAYSPCGTRLAIGAVSFAGSSTLVRLFDASTWQPVEESSSHAGGVGTFGNVSWTSVVFGSDGGTLAATSRSSVRILDANTLSEFRRLEDGTTHLRSVSPSPDGRFLAAACVYGRIVVWHASTARIAKHLEGHARMVFSVRYSPDGRVLASGADDGTIRLWEAVITGFELRTLRGHTGSVRTVDYCPSGKVLASGGGSRVLGEVILWDPSSGKMLHMLRLDRGPVNAVAFSPDGRLLAAGTEDGTVRLWDVSGYTLGQ